MLEFECKIWNAGLKKIAGVDEAGRGPLAGPVVAAAVIFPEGYYNDDINDSKKLSPAKREKLYDVICRNAVCYNVAMIDNNIIDEINILNATFAAMKSAIRGLVCKPDHLLIDGNRFCEFDIPFSLIVKGDSKSISIAAASILAKVTRDRIMNELTFEYPEYKLAKHKGYGTKEHIELIKYFGKSPIHRKSFLLKGIDY